MENSKELFDLALGLSLPWEVKEVKMEKGKDASKELHLTLSFRKGSKFISQDGERYSTYDTIERKWEHLSFFEHKCCLHAKVPRVKQNDGKVVTVNVPWAKKGNDLLKVHKYTFLKSKLTLKIQTERDLLLEMYPILGEAYRLVALFKDFWDLTEQEEAEGYLAFWCDLADESKIFPFMNVAGLIRRHWRGIINYIKSRISNGILEGINSKIQLAKRRARGFRNMDNFINMIYFICGKLKFDYQLYST